MATRFRADSTKRKSPPWCKPGMFPITTSTIGQLMPPPPPWVQGLPPVLFAFFGPLLPIVAAGIVALPARLVFGTWWLDLNAEPPIDIYTSFPTQWDESMPGWSGWSPPGPLRLYGEVYMLPTPGQYDVHLKVYRGQVLLDDDSWHNVFALDPPKHDTGQLEHIYDPHIDTNGAWHVQ